MIHMAEEMRSMALATGAFRLHSLHATAAAEAGWGESEEALAKRRAVEGGWLRVRPYGVPTERDKVCETNWKPVYRTLLEKKGEATEGAASAAAAAEAAAGGAAPGAAAAGAAGAEAEAALF